MANPKSKILVSACLYGFCCRYDGKSNLLKDKMFMALKMIDDDSFVVIVKEEEELAKYF